MDRALAIEHGRRCLTDGSCLQDSRFWGRGSDSEDDSEEDVSDSEEEEESDASDSDSDSSDNEEGPGYVHTVATHFCCHTPPIMRANKCSLDTALAQCGLYV
jgi:hypothetical protein